LILSQQLTGGGLDMAWKMRWIRYGSWAGCRWLMTLKLNNTLPIPVNQHFYTDLEKKLFTVDLYLPFPQGVNPNYCACPLFYSTEATPWAAGFHMCLSPDEMNSQQQYGESDGAGPAIH
jgi:hypothetical protein